MISKIINYFSPKKAEINKLLETAERLFKSLNNFNKVINESQELVAQLTREKTRLGVNKSSELDKVVYLLDRETQKHDEFRMLRCNLMNDLNLATQKLNAIKNNLTDSKFRVQLTEQTKKIADIMASLHKELSP